MKGKYKSQNDFIKNYLYNNEFFKTRSISITRQSENQMTYNFKCPICGDSQKNIRKKRGYLIYDDNKKGGFKYYCHNCGEQLSFIKFLGYLKDKYNLNFYDQWKKSINIFQEEKYIEYEEMDYAKFFKLKNKIYDYVDKIHDNIAVYNYVKKRQIPIHYLNKKVFSYSGSFEEFINNDPLKIFSSITMYDFYKYKNDYVVFLNEAYIDGYLLPVGFTIRQIKGTFRYFNIPINGLDKVSFICNVLDIEEVEDSPIIITEGPVDALMFDMPTFAMKSNNLKKIYEIDELYDNIKIFAFDNELKSHHDIIKNEQTLRKAKEINKDDYVVMWHKDKKNYHKDPNEMIMSGMEYPLDGYMKKFIVKGLSKEFEFRSV